MYAANKNVACNMKTFQLLTVLLVLMTTVLTGCEVIGDIFQAGVWVGVLLVVGVVVFVLWLIGKVGRRS